MGSDGSIQGEGLGIGGGSGDIDLYPSFLGRNGGGPGGISRDIMPVSL